eukprot:2424913-Rhodomonas_salina.1
MVPPYAYHGTGILWYHHTRRLLYQGTRWLLYQCTRRLRYQDTRRHIGDIGPALAEECRLEPLLSQRLAAIWPISVPDTA